MDHRPTVRVHILHRIKCRYLVSLIIAKRRVAEIRDTGERDGCRAKPHLAL